MGVVRWSEQECRRRGFGKVGIGWEGKGGGGQHNVT